MKKKWLGIRIIAGLCAALGWWGLLYPELALTPDTVNVYLEEEEGELCELIQEWDFDGSLYHELLSADRDKITFRSKLFTEIRELFKSFNNS